MAHRRGIQLTAEHRDRIATGLCTLAELAEELGCSRQSIWTGFSRRGWPSRPIDHNGSKSEASAQPAAEPGASGSQKAVQGGRASRPRSPAPASRGASAASYGPASADELTSSTVRSASNVPAADHPTEAREEIVTTRATRPASASAASRAPSLPPEPSPSPEPPHAPATAILSPTLADDADLTEVARQELGNVALLVLAQTRDALARAQLGAQAIKALAGAAEVADRLLRRAGYDVAGSAGGQVPQLTICEMSAERQAEIQAQAEAEYRGERPGC